MTSLIAPAIAIGRQLPTSTNVDDASLRTTKVASGGGDCGKSFAVGANYGAKIRFVEVLLGLRNPLAIARFVIAVIINSVERQVRSVAIGKRPIAKVFEAFPLGTNGDAATAVAGKSMASNIAAPLPHRVPSLEKTGAGLAMNKKPAAGALPLETSAGLHMAAAKFATVDSLFVTAHTPAPPTNCFMGTRTGTALQHGQSTKLLACDVNGAGQGDLLQRLLRQVVGWRSNAGPSRILAYGSAR